MIRESLIHPNFQGEGFDEQLKKRLTYLRKWQPYSLHFDQAKHDLWKEREQWKKMGYAHPPILAMAGSPDDWLQRYYPPNFGSDTEEQLLSRIFLW